MAVAYDVGDTITILGEFKNNAGDFGDPNEVILTVRRPSGTYISYYFSAAEITKITVGKYSKDIVPDDEGVWWYKWEGVGTIDEVFEGSFAVRPQKVQTVPQESS